MKTAATSPQKQENKGKWHLCIHPRARGLDLRVLFPPLPGSASPCGSGQCCAAKQPRKGEPLGIKYEPAFTFYFILFFCCCFAQFTSEHFQDGRVCPDGWGIDDIIIIIIISAFF